MLIDTKTFNYINVTTGEDFFDAKEVEYKPNYKWKGAGSFEGSSSPNMFIHTSKQIIPTLKSDAQMKLISKQVEDIKKIGNKIKDVHDPKISDSLRMKRKEEALDLVKKIKISPRLPHQTAITGNTHEIVKQALQVTSKKELEDWVKSNI